MKKERLVIKIADNGSKVSGNFERAPKKVEVLATVNGNGTLFQARKVGKNPFDQKMAAWRFYIDDDSKDEHPDFPGPYVLIRGEFRPIKARRTWKKSQQRPSKQKA